MQICPDMTSSHRKLTKGSLRKDLIEICIKKGTTPTSVQTVKEIVKSIPSNMKVQIEERPAARLLVLGSTSPASE